MAKLISSLYVSLLLLGLVCVIFAQDVNLAATPKCNIVVQQTKTTTSNYIEYTAVAINKGSLTATNIVLTASTTLKSCSLSRSNSGYVIDGSLAVGASASFTFSVKKGNTVTFKSACKLLSAAPVTTAPAAGTTKAPTATGTTKAPSSGTPATPNTSGGRLCPAGSWWAPKPMTTWQWQLTGNVDTSFNVQMYDIDLFSAASSPSIISTLHKQGKAVICYFSTQYENWRSDASKFPKAAIGAALDDWEGENYVDIRNAAVRTIMKARLDLAASIGCDGVEPDNVDGYTASNGISPKITAADQLNYNQFFATESHARGLSVGLKNDMDQLAALQPYFDWALNEQCKQYSECGGYSVFTKADKAVFNAEYSGTASSVCASMNTAKISALIKNLNLNAEIKAQCCTSASGGCTSPAYTCKTSSKKRSVEAVENVEVVEDNIEDAEVVEDNTENVDSNNVEGVENVESNTESNIESNNIATEEMITASATTTQIAFPVVVAVAALFGLLHF